MDLKNREVGFMIKLIHDKLGAKIDVLFRQLNLTERQSQILWYLKTNHDKMVTQKELEVAFSVSHPTISRMLKGLEKKNFIRTYMNPENKKMKVVELDQHEEYISDEPKKEFEKILLKGFTFAETKQLKEYLLQIYKNISDAD